MESPDIEPGPTAVDPDYAALFRPEPEQDEPIVIIEPAEPVVLVEPTSPVEADLTSEPDLPFVPADLVDTGRLFRSQGVTDHDLAVLALASSHSGRLRTLDRTQPEPPPAGPIDGHDGRDITAGAVGGVVLDEADQPARESRRSKGRSKRPGKGRTRDHAATRQAGRITGGAVYLIVIGVTVLVGFANALLLGGHLGWPTGVALVVSSVYCALTVHRDDDVVAIITPPVAFLAASLTAGQLFLGAAEASPLNRAVVVFFSLADNWYWIIGATVAALVIVLVRRRRS